MKILFPQWLVFTVLVLCATPGHAEAQKAPVSELVQSLEAIFHAGDFVPISRNVFRAGDYGAVADGKTVSTRALQSAIDAAHEVWIDWTMGDVKPIVTWTTASQASANESGTLTATAQLSSTYTQSVTVPFTVSGTATNGTDYTITASPITIASGAAARRWAASRRPARPLRRMPTMPSSWPKEITRSPSRAPSARPTTPCSSTTSRSRW